MTSDVKLTSIVGFLIFFLEEQKFCTVLNGADVIVILQISTCIWMALRIDPR